MTHILSLDQSFPIRERGNQRERDRERAQARAGGKAKQPIGDGLTPEQRRERDAKALQEKAAQTKKALKLNADKNNNANSPWRLELSKIDVWYASFGSNMWKPRFLCYVEGGKVEGMQSSCCGSLDKTPPKKILWGTYPHRLFFGRERTNSWGLGGVAFLNPERNIQDKAYLCLYRITLEQFNDILRQENYSGHSTDSPLFNLDDLISVASNESNSLELQKKCWYSNVVYLGKEEDIPILTMTCVNSYMESFKSGKLPIVAPCKEYMNTLVRGLVEGRQLSEKEAMAYIQEATKKPL